MSKKVLFRCLLQEKLLEVPEDADTSLQSDASSLVNTTQDDSIDPDEDDTNRNGAKQISDDEAEELTEMDLHVQQEPTQIEFVF